MIITQKAETFTNFIKVSFNFTLANLHLPDDASDTLRVISKELLSVQAKSEGIQAVAVISGT